MPAGWDLSTPQKMFFPLFSPFVAPRPEDNKEEPWQCETFPPLAEDKTFRVFLAKKKEGRSTLSFPPSEGGIAPKRWVLMCEWQKALQASQAERSMALHHGFPPLGAELGPLLTEHTQTLRSSLLQRCKLLLLLTAGSDFFVFVIDHLRW